MAPKKKAKAKTLGKKDLKKTKGGLNFAAPTGSSVKIDFLKSDLTINNTVSPDSINLFK